MTGALGVTGALGAQSLLASIEVTLDLPEHFLDEGAQRAGFVLLGAFLLSFLFIRTSARLMRSPRVSWWPGSVKTSSGLHLHHLVWGILLLLVSGFLEFATDPASPWNEILAAAFGIGAGLTLDEFALWVHLRDVYWSEEGRSSLDAVVIASALAGLILLGIAPFDVPNNSSSVSTLAGSIVVDLSLAALAMFKGKPVVGMIGLFIPPVSLVGACRLATPESPWARWFYAPQGKKLARSRRRYERIRGRHRRLADAIAGAPAPPSG